MTNPTQINQGGAQTHERQDPKNTGTRAEKYSTNEAGGEVEGTSGTTLTRGPLDKGDARKEKQVKEGQG